MVIYTVKEFWGCPIGMEEEWNAERGGEGKKLSEKEKGKLCNSYLPLQRNSGNNPCN